MSRNYWESEQAKRNIIWNCEQIAWQEYHSWDEWLLAISEMKELMQQWRSAGHAGDYEEDLWNQFSSARHTFFQDRDDFIQSVHDARSEVIRDAELLISQLATASTKFERRDLASSMKDLQAIWKEIPWVGYAPWMDHSCRDMKKTLKDLADYFFEIIRNKSTKSTARQSGNSQNRSESYNNNHRNRNYYQGSGDQDTGYHNHEQKLTLEYAVKLFGISPPLTAQSIKCSYRRLIQKHHPDKGGSVELAQLINAARGLLLEAI